MNVASFVLIGCLWGCSFPAIKIVVTSAPPLFAVFMRIFISLVTLTFLLKLMRKPLMVQRSDRWKCWGTGLLSLALPFSALYWGEQRVSASAAAVINGSAPIWAFLLSLLFMRGDERLNLSKGFGVALGFLGIVSLYFPSLAAGDFGYTSGLLAVTVMALSYAVSTTLNRRFFTSGTISPYASLYQQHASSVVVLFVVSLAVDGGEGFRLFFASWKPFIATLYLACFSTALAWILFFRLLRQWGSVKTISVAYIVPIVALMADAIIFQKLPEAHAFLGAAMILGGTFLTQTGGWRVIQRLAPSAGGAAAAGHPR